MLSKTKTVLVEISSRPLINGDETIDQYIRSKFEGRKRLLDRFVQKLESAKGATGVYLVTGYRGVGKTRFVEESIKKSQLEPNEIRTVHLSLSQNEVTEHGLLRQMALSLVEEIEVSTKVQSERLSNANSILLPFVILASALVYFISYPLLVEIAKKLPEASYRLILLYKKETLIFIFILFEIISISTVMAMKTTFIKKRQKSIFEEFSNRCYKTKPSRSRKIIKRLIYSKYLNILSINTRMRLFTSIVKESSKNDGNNTLLKLATSALLGRTIMSSSDNKLVSQSNILSTKELESLLIKLINHFQWYNTKYVENGFRQIVFVIDELDKIEPSRDIATLTEKQNVEIDINVESKTKAQQRQQTITRLLANLKNFTHSIDAITIFIGGRGMYDASLADIADRESFYSSVFDDIFYINSLFKDKLSENGGMSEIIDALLFSVLNIQDVKSLEDLGKKLHKSQSEVSLDLLESNAMAKQKINHTLQNYITFLTYRSNGTPKKFIELISKRVVKYSTRAVKEYLPKNDRINSTHIVLFCDCTLDTGNIKNKTIPNQQIRYFLEFDARNQYLINLTSRLYRPYMLGGTRYLKSLSDKLLYSGAFLIDHIVKFHRNSFEYQDLELIPDTILINQDANFRFFFKDILNLFLRNDLRVTLNGMSQYKFNSLTANEFKFASRVSESSSAAFNFTLDQSFHLKAYYKRMLVSKQHEYRISPSSTKFVHSISYLRSLLGDLHFYDAQFRDAVQYYTDSIQPFREYLSGDADTKPTHQYVLYTKNKLKLGLSLERLFSYDKAYSIYRSLTLELDRFVPSNAMNDSWELPYKRMQLFSRPYISLLGTIEKQRHDGITISNLTRNLESYCKFLSIKSQYLFPITKSHTGLEFKYDKWYNEITTESSKKKVFVTGFDSDQEVSYSNRNNNILNQDRKRIIALLVDYYISISDLLYYKNRLIFSIFTSHNSSKICKEVATLKTRHGNNYYPSLTSYKYYMYALRLFVEPYIENMSKDKFRIFKNRIASQNVLRNKLENEANLVLSTTYFLGNHAHNSLNSQQYTVLSSLLSKTSDALFSFVTSNETLEFLHDALELFIDNTPVAKFKNIILDDKHNKNSLIVSIVCSALSYRIAMLNANTSTALLQIKRTLHICRGLLIEEKKSGNMALKSEEKLYTVIQKLFDIYFIDLIQSSQVATRDELFKYQSYSFETTTPYMYLQLSDSHEARSMLFLYHDIQESLQRLTPKSYQSIIDYFKSGLTSTSSMFSQIATYTFMYRYFVKEIKSLRNRFYTATEFREITKGEITNKDKIKKYFDLFKGFTKDKLDNLADAIYSISETERLLSLYDANYIFSYSYRFDTSRRLGDLSRIYTLLSTLYDTDSNIIEKLTQNYEDNYDVMHTHNLIYNFKYQVQTLLGDRYKLFLNEFKHYDSALNHYDQTKSLHKEGSAYRDQIKDMYILDDDYNDLFMHFCAAYERYRLHSTNLEKSADKIKNYLKNNSNMYNMSKTFKK